MSMITLKHLSWNDALTKVRHLFCDAQLKTTTKEFNAHRLVLAAESDYFMKMFTSSCQEQNGTVHMEIDDEITPNYGVHLHRRMHHQSYESETSARMRTHAYC